MSRTTDNSQPLPSPGDDAARRCEPREFLALVVALIARLRKLDPAKNLIGTGWEAHLTVFQRLGHLNPHVLSGLPPELALRIWMALAEDESPQVRGRLLNYPECPVVVLERLATDHETDIRVLVAEHPACPAGLLRALFDTGHWRVRRAVLAHLHCPPEVIRSCATSRHQGILRAIAGNPSSPSDVLTRLCRNRDPFVLRDLAANPCCGGEQLRTMVARIAKDFPVAPNGNSSLALALHKVFAVVADNPSCPPDLFQRVVTELLAGGDHHSQFLVSAASCPEHILRRFARRRIPDVRESIGYNPNCPADVMEKLAVDRDDCVRDMVALNPNTPERVLGILAEDKSPWVRNRVVDHRNCPENLRKRILATLAASSDSEFRKAAAGQSRCPPDMLAVLACDKDEWVRTSVARNPAALPIVFPVLWNDASAYVQEEIRKRFGSIDQLTQEVEQHQARNFNTPPADLLHLAASGFYSVRLEALCNPAFPASLHAEFFARTVTEISGWFGTEKPPIDATPVTAGDVLLAFRALNIVKSADDQRKLDSLSRSRDWLKRAAAACFSAVSSRAFVRLLHDQNRTVRFFVEQRLANAHT